MIKNQKYKSSFDFFFFFVTVQFFPTPTEINFEFRYEKINIKFCKYLHKDLQLTFAITFIL